MTVPSLKSLTSELLSSPPLLESGSCEWISHAEGITARLEGLGTAGTSASGRAQNLMAAGLVAAFHGDRAHATELLRRATKNVPRLATLGMLYRAVGVGLEADDLICLSLEQTLKLSELDDARAHAARKLGRLHEKGGRLREALIALETLGATDQDPSLGLRKALLSLALGEPVTHSAEQLRGLSEVQSVLDPRKAVSAPSPGLLLLLAARALASGDFDRFLSLVSDFTDQAGREHQLSEKTLGVAEATRIGLLFARKSSESAALARAKELVGRKFPGQLLPRFLARISARVRDSAGIHLALESRSPGSPTFDAAEQVLLSYLAGSPISPEGANELNLEEMSAELRWAVTSRPIGVQTAKEVAQAAIGAQLGRMDGDPFQEAAATWMTVEPSARAELLPPLLGVLSDDAQTRVSALEELARLNSEPAFDLLGARSAEQAGLMGRATAIYERLSSLEHPGLAIEGMLGLDRTVGPSLELSRRLVDGARKLPPSEASALLLAGALGLDESTSAAALRESSELSEPGSRERGKALLASYIQERRAFGTMSRPEAMEEYLTDPNAELRDAVAVIWAWAVETPEEAHEALGAVSKRTLESEDLRRIRIALGDPFEVLPESPGSLWATAEHFLARATSGDRHGAYEVLAQAGPLSPGLIDSLRRQLELDLGISGAAAIDLIEGTPSLLDPKEQETATYQLIAFEEARGDRKSADMWRRFMVNAGLGGPGALLGLETEAYRERSISSIRSVAHELAEKLPGPDRHPYLAVLAALALGEGDLRAARRSDNSDESLFMRRTLSTEAWDRSDVDRVRTLLKELLPYAGEAQDQVALLTELSRLTLLEPSQASDARKWAEAAQTELPHSFVPALLALAAADAESEQVDTSSRSELLLKLADASSLPEHRVAILLEAGDAFERQGDLARAEQCFERCLAEAPDAGEAFARLRSLLKNSRSRTLKLLEARLEHSLPSSLRTELELEVAELLSGEGKTKEAEDLLKGALKREPSHIPLLAAHAQAAEKLGKFADVVASLRKAADLLPKGPERLRTLRVLANTAATHLGRYDLAMGAYEAIVQEAPDDLGAMRALVEVYVELRLVERASALQTQVIQTATSTEEKIDAVVRLAQLYRTLAGDPGRAMSTLERASRAWPLDARVLGARAEMLAEAGEKGARRMLVERAGKEARRQLESGRLDAGLLDTLALSYSLLEHVELSRGANLARQVLLQESILEDPPYHGRALAPSLHAFLAPSSLSRALVPLLLSTAAALDLAFSFDPAQMNATRVEGTRRAELAQLFEPYRLEGLEFFEVSDPRGSIVPVSHSPARFLVAREALARSPEELEFLVYRAVKIHSLGAASLARHTPEDRAAILGGLLLSFSPHVRALGVDPRKLGQCRALLEQAFTRTGYSNDVPTLALEAVGALGNTNPAALGSSRLSHPGLVELANRAALLSTGRLGRAISALAPASNRPPSSGPERARWFDDEPEARDLLLFRTSDAYLGAVSQIVRMPPGR